MIISNEKIGETFRVLTNDRITKDEFEKLKKGDRSVLKDSGIDSKELVAASLLEKYHGYAIEDEDEMIHVMSLGAVFQFDLLEILKDLPEIGSEQKEKE